MLRFFFFFQDDVYVTGFSCLSWNIEFSGMKDLSHSTRKNAVLIDKPTKQFNMMVIFFCTLRFLINFLYVSIVHFAFFTQFLKMVFIIILPGCYFLLGFFAVSMDFLNLKLIISFSTTGCRGFVIEDN